eukprot:tig00001001_g6215.t1
MQPSSASSALDDVLESINAPNFVDFNGEATWTGDRWFDMHGAYTPSGLARSRPFVPQTPELNKENPGVLSSPAQQTPVSARKTPISSRKTPAVQPCRTPLRVVQATEQGTVDKQRLYPTPEKPSGGAGTEQAKSDRTEGGADAPEADSFDVIEIDFGDGSEHVDEAAGGEAPPAVAALMQDDGTAVQAAQPQEEGRPSHEGPIPAWLVVEDAEEAGEKREEAPAAPRPAPAAPVPAPAPGNLRSVPWATTIDVAPAAKKQAPVLRPRPSSARAPAAPTAASKARAARASVARPSSAGRRAVSVLRGRASRVEEPAARRRAASLSPLREEGEDAGLARAGPPTLRTTSRLRGKREASTEEREMEVSRKGREFAASLKELNRRMMEKALVGDGLRPNLHSTKELTRPHEPRLRTAERTTLSGDGRSTSAGRSRSATRRETETPRGDYIPLAQSVERFLTKTPTRFHSKPRAQDKPSPPPKAVPHSTVPVAPALATDTRVGRKPAPPRTSDVEAEEARRLAGSFKARPLDRRVLESRGDLGVPRVPKKPTTEAHEPQLRTAQRATAQLNASALSEAAELERSFKARPYNAKRMAAAEMPPPPPRAPLTEPQSPALATRQRASVRPKAEAPAPPPAFRARPMPVPEPPRPEARPAPKAPTSPEPFRLATEERGAARRAEWLAAVETEMRQEAAAREFRAREMPVGSPMRVVYPEHAIEVKPFSVSLERVELAKARMAALIAEKARRIQEEAEFHARAWDRDRAEDYWTPHLDNRPPVQPEEPGLHSSERAERRRQFDAVMAAKEAEIAAARSELLAAKEEEERREVAEMRRSMVHHAEPIRRYKPTAITRSTAPLTEPKTPTLETTRRTRSRTNGADESFALA